MRGSLNLDFLPCFKKLVPPGGWLYAMDWHVGWRFFPHREFDARDVRAWGISVLPHGDYTVFLTPDLRQGTFGHPWEGTICLFGNDLLDSVAAEPPTLFGKPLRRDGQLLTPDLMTRGSLFLGLLKRRVLGYAGSGFNPGAAHEALPHHHRSDG